MPQEPDDNVRSVDIVAWDYLSARVNAGVAILRLHRPDGSMLDLLLTAEQERTLAFQLGYQFAADLIADFAKQGWVIPVPADSAKIPPEDS